MASQWRIRHKLRLALGLVVANMAILLCGSLWGLGSYSKTMNSIHRKVEEQSAAEEVQQCITGLENLDPEQTPGGQSAVLRDRLETAKQALEKYKAQLKSPRSRSGDILSAFERDLVGALETAFVKLDQAIHDATEPTMLGGGISVDLLAQKPVHEAITEIRITSDQLRDQLKQDIDQLIRETRGPYRNSLVIVIGTCSLGIGLMVGLVWYFFIWVIHPIRDLHEGAERLARGDFEHRMDVHSGDEMQDLAQAFNNMSDRLRDMYRDLAHQVNERSRQLVRSERLAGVGFLAAGVAHEINNPLASIAFCSEALETRLSRILSRVGGEGETIVKHLRTIQEEAFRCKAITQRLLEFSRGSEPSRERTNVTQIVQAVLDMVQHLPNAKDKTIDLLTPDAAYAWVNAQEIKSVALNLVVNALDSMEEGGHLTIALEQVDSMTEIVFTDDGCGMDEEVLENLFEPFFTRSRTGKGTGLGLSISHRIITQHGGEIEAASPGPKRGSTFRVRLPIGPPAGVREDNLAHAAAA